MRLREVLSVFYDMVPQPRHCENAFVLTHRFDFVLHCGTMVVPNSLLTAC